MTPDPATLPADMTIHAALRFFTEEATHRSYPVVDAEGRLVGLASRSDALRWKAGAFDENTTLTETLSDASRSDEHTSELQSIMRISYAVFCLKKKIENKQKRIAYGCEER